MPSGNNEYGSKAVLPRDRFTIHILYSFFTEKPRPLGPRLFRIYSYSSLACFFFRRDYFFCADASLSCSFSPQGLFLPPGFISILLFFSAGMISAAQMHPQLAFLCRRDDFCCSDASPACSFPPQGLLRPPGFIPSLLFCAAGIISSAQMQLAFLCRRDDFFRSDASPACFFHHRDYCDRPDSSPACSFLPQG